MAVRVARNEGDTALPAFVLFSFSPYFRCLILQVFHTARNAEVQEGAAQCSCVTDAPWAQPVALVCSPHIRGTVTPSVKACHLCCVTYTGTSTTSRATTYPVHLHILLEVTFKNIPVWS